MRNAILRNYLKGNQQKLYFAFYCALKKTKKNNNSFSAVGRLAQAFKRKTNLSSLTSDMEPL